MRNRALILLSFLLLLAGLGTFWVRWGLPRVERRLHAKVKSTLSSLLQRPVSLERTRLHPLLLSVALEGLRVKTSETPEAPDVFSCRRWRLFLAPFHHSPSFPWISVSIGKSRVEGALLDVEALLSAGRGRAPASSLALLPAHRLEWEDSRVSFPSVKTAPAFALERGAGSAVLSGTDLSFDLRGGTPWGPLSAAGNLTMKNGRDLRWKALLRLPEGRLEDLIPLSPIPLRGKGEGPVALSLVLEKKEGLTWVLDAVFKKGASWTFDRLPWPIEGEASFSENRVELGGLRLGGLTVDGRVDAPWENPRADLTLRAERFKLEDLRSRLPWKGLSILPWRGEASLKASIKGFAARPDVDLSLNALGAGVGPFVFPELDAEISSDEEKIALRADLAGGTLEARALRGEEGAGLSAWECRLERLSIDALARAGGWGNVRGTVSGDFALRRSSGTAAPLAGGVLRLERPSWGDHELNETLISYFSWRDGVLRFHNKTDTFDLVVQRREGGWTLSRLAYTRSDGLSLMGEGRIDGPGRDLSFKASLRQASLRDIPFLLEKFPDIDGRWQADLHGAGTLSRPRMAVSLEGGGLRFQKEGSLHAFQGRARWDDGLFLDEFSLDAAWKASASRAPDGTWKVDASAQGGDLALFGEISGSTSSITGLLDARLSASGGGSSTPSGSLDAVIPSFRRGEGDPSPAAIKLRWQEDAVRIDEASLGIFSYQGEARRRAPGLWRASAEGNALPRAEGDLRVDGGLVSFRGWSLGDGLSLEALVSLPKRSVEARITARDSDVDSLARRAGASAPSGSGGALNGTVLFQGPWAAPQASVDLHLSGARWRDVPFTASLRGRGAGVGFAMQELRVDADAAGHAVISGTIPWRTSAPLSLEWRVDDAPIAVLGLPAAGRWSAEGRVEGPRNDPFGTLRWRSAAVALGTLPPFSVDIEAAYVQKALTIKTGEASTPEGRWRLRPGGRMVLDGENVRFDLSNDLRNVRIGPLSLFGGVRLAGNWAFTQPLISATLTAEDLWANQQSLNGEIARFAWTPGRITFDAATAGARRLGGAIDVSAWPSLIFDDVSYWEEGDRRLHLNGRLGTEGPWEFSVEGHGLQAGTLLSLADVDATGEGAVDFFLTGSGTGKSPRLEGDVLGQNGSLMGIPYDKLHLDFSWDRKRIALRRLNLSRRRGYVLEGTGEREAPARDDAPARVSMLFRLTHGNLAILKDLWPDCRQAKGGFEGEFAVSPGPDGPSVTGWFSLENGAFRADRYLRDVSDLDVTLTLLENRILLEKVSGQAGAGPFVMGGSIVLEDLRIGEYDVFLRTPGRRGISIEMPQLSVPPGPLLNRFSILRKTLQAASQGRPRLDVTVKGPHGAHRIAGEIILDDTRFTYPPLPGAFKGGRRDSWWSEFWREASWDIALKTGKDTWYRNEHVNVHVDGKVLIRGPQEAMVVEGKVAADQGVINYLGQPFQVKKALFEVSGGTRTDVSDERTSAYLSGEAERSATTLDARGVASLDTVTMIIPRARLGEIRPRFVSRNNPGLASDRVFQKLLGFSAQDPMQPPTPEEQDQLLRAGLVQLVGSSAGPFANRLARLFGIDMISAIYEPTAPTGDQGRPQAPEVRPSAAAAAPRWANLLRGTGASAGVRLTDRVFGVYKFTVDQTLSNRVYLHDELQVVGRVAGSLYLKFSSELDARSVLGQPPARQALLEHQWRFGLPRRKPKKREETDDKTP